METFVLNLDRRLDRWSRVDKLLKNHGIVATRWSAIDGKSISFVPTFDKVKKQFIRRPEGLACALSHISIIKHAKANNLERIMVLEDDIYLHKDFSKLIDTIPDADLVYLGGTQFKWNGTETSPYYRSHNTLGTFAMVIRSSLYQPILDAWEVTPWTIDNMLAEHIQSQPEKYVCYTMWPNLVACDVSNSDIRTGWDVDKHCQAVRWNKNDYRLPPRDNWLEQVTFGITHFDRPEHLNRCIESIQNLWPEAKILVADNSVNGRPNISIPMLELEPDCGVSKCRNELMKAIDTDYLMLCEEDFIFTNDSKIETFFKFLEKKHDYGVVGGSLYHGEKLEHHTINIYERNNELVQIESDYPFEAIDGIQWKRCDKVFDFCLIRKGCGRWNEDIKIGGDHLWYFWNLKKEGEWKVANVPQVTAIHNREDRSEHYRQYRSRDFKENLGIGANFSFALVKDKPNIVVLGVGHTGTTILTKFINTLGWNKCDADDKYCESVSVRATNQNIIANKYTESDLKNTLSKLESPWVIKDPRFVACIDKWYAAFDKYKPLLIGITKDIDEVKKSYDRRKEKHVTHSGHTIDEYFELFKKQYDAWPWAKIMIRYEDLAACAKMWNR